MEFNFMEQAVPMIIAFAMARLIMWPIRPKGRVVTGAVMVSYGLLVICFWDMSVLSNLGWAVGWIMGGYPVLFKWANNPSDLSERKSFSQAGPRKRLRIF